MMQSITEVTYTTTQGLKRQGYYEGFSHKMTGELLITDMHTGNQVYIKPINVNFGD